MNTYKKKLVRYFWVKKILVVFQMDIKHVQPAATVTTAAPTTPVPTAHSVSTAVSVATQVEEPKLYIAPGIYTKVARDHGVKNDAAKKVITKECLSIIKTYKEGKSLAFFDDIHRASLHVIGQSNAISIDVYSDILKDLSICDNVLMQLRGILQRAYSAERRTEFTLALQKFWDKLRKDKRHEHLHSSLVEVFEVLLKYRTTPPNEPSQNDRRLLEILERASSGVPSYVNITKKQDFQVDRIEMVNDLLKKMMGAKNSSVEENPWALD